MPGWASNLPLLQYITTAFDNIKDAVLLMELESEANFRIVLANKAFHEMSGFTKDSIGKTPADLLDAETYVFVRKQFETVVRTKQPVEFIHWINVPLGRRAYEARMIPILSTFEEVVQIVILASDITETAQLKEKVRLLRAKAYDKSQAADTI